MQLSGKDVARVAEKVAMITGGGSGIGRATALLFAREGAAVALADVNTDAGRRVADEIAQSGGRALFEPVDVTRAADCRRLVERAIREFGRIDILFNNAGIILRATVLDLSEDDWDRVMAVNVKSIYLLSREVIPHIQKAGGGTIINTASGWGLTGGAKAAVYCASKGAVVLLTKAMAIDHGPQKIRVNCICPGDTDTGMLHEEARALAEWSGRFFAAAPKRRLGRAGTAEEILLNNGGGCFEQGGLEWSEEEWDLQIDINLKGTFLMSKFALGPMIVQGGGVIINNSSGWGIVGGDKAVAYCASKGGVVLLTKAMAVDHGRQGIRVNCICPGDVDTPMLPEDARLRGLDWKTYLAGCENRPMGRIGTVAGNAKAVRVLASDG